MISHPLVKKSGMRAGRPPGDVDVNRESASQ